MKNQCSFHHQLFRAFSLTHGRNVSGKCIHIIHGRAPGVVFILVFLHGCHRTVALGGCWDGACCSDCWSGPGDISLQRRVQWKLGIAGVSRLPTDGPLPVMVSLYLLKLQYIDRPWKLRSLYPSSHLAAPKIDGLSSFFQSINGNFGHSFV